MKQWKWIRCPLDAYAGLTFEGALDAYGGDMPVGLLTDFTHLEGYTVLNLFAPRHHAFLAAVPYRFIQAASDSLAPLYGDKAARARFLKDIRLAGIDKTSNTLRFLNAVAARLGVSGTTVPSIGANPRAYPERLRFWSIGFPTERTEQVLRYLERECGQLGPHAFFAIDNAVELADPRGPSSVGTYLFHNVVRRTLSMSQAAQAEMCAAVLDELKVLVRRLERGCPFDTPVEPVWHIKAQVGFRIMWDGPEYLELLSWRARLVRLLGWPQHYPSVCQAIGEMHDGEAEGKNVDLAGCGPYDIATELRACRAALEERYPVLTEDLGWLVA